MYSGYFSWWRDLAPLAVGAGAWAWKKWKVRGNVHWPTAQGTVWSYRFDSKVPTVVYTFYVNGHYYSGEFEAPKPKKFFIFPTDASVEERYPQGTPLLIRYNPDDPSLSVPTGLPSLLWAS